MCSHRVWVGVALFLDDITCIDLDGRLRRSILRERHETTENTIKCDMDNTAGVRRASPSSRSITESLLEGGREYVAVCYTLDDASLASIRWAVTSIRPST